MSSIADNVILLRYLEVRGHLDRAISILKARATAHSTELRSFVITGQGAAVGGPLTQLRGVLTGLPVAIPDRPEPVKKDLA